MNLIKKSILFIALKLLTITLFIALMSNCNVRKKPDNLEKKLIDLCKVLPSDFSEYGSPRSIIKYDRGTYGLRFRSNLNYDEVKKFYSEKLLPQGWRILEESDFDMSSDNKLKYLSFHHNEGYSIHLETFGYSTNNEKITYLVNCSWKSF